MEDAEDMGKATGVLSTVYFAHATPAGHIVHIRLPLEIQRNRQSNVVGKQGRRNYRSRPSLVRRRRQTGGRPRSQSVRYAETLRPRRRGGELEKNPKRRARRRCGRRRNADAWTMVDSRQDIRKVAGLTENIPKRLLGVVPVYSTLQQSRSGNQYLPPYGEAQLTASPTMTELMAAALKRIETGRRRLRPHGRRRSHRLGLSRPTNRDERSKNRSTSTALSNTPSNGSNRTAVGMKRS